MRRKDEKLINWHICQLRKSLSIAVLLLISFLGYAQTRVSGKVIDVNGDALIGVNVIVAAIRQGTITNVDGEFILTVPNMNVAIEFSYVGFQTQTVSLNGRTNLEVTLLEDIEMLEEVIVVGYGTVRKRDLTGILERR